MSAKTLAEKHYELDRDLNVQAERNEAEYVEEPSFAGATAGGDKARLRGVPVQAQGVGGAIWGSRPGKGGSFR